MEAYIATAGAIVALVSAIVAAVLGIWTARQAQRAQQVEAYRAVHDLYDRMVQLKFNNPDFLLRARDWDNSRMGCVYDGSHDEHEDWSRYYTFVELCIGFANSVLQARSRNLMERDEYEKQWERLVRLVVTAHYPIIKEFLDEGPYVSEYMRDYIQTTERDCEWDWVSQHRLLPWSDDPANKCIASVTLPPRDA